MNHDDDSFATVQMAHLNGFFGGNIDSIKAVIKHYKEEEDINLEMPWRGNSRQCTNNPSL